MTSVRKGFLKKDHNCCNGKGLMLCTTIKQRASIHHKALKESEKKPHIGKKILTIHKTKSWQSEYIEISYTLLRKAK